MELLNVQISLDRVFGRIEWQVTQDRLPDLRMAIKKGEFGPARILSVESATGEVLSIAA
jgi:hypothetical protein